MNQKILSNGCGRLNCNTLNYFTLTRKVNYPELVFNQHILKDHYFEVDSSQKWRLSQNNECYVCHKYQYVAIFFEQAKTGGNEDLIEIKDEPTLSKIEENLDMNLKDKFMVAPIILGSVCVGGFSRKLRMLHAGLFALLSVSQSNKFLSERKTSESIKKGVVKTI